MNIGDLVTIYDRGDQNCDVYGLVIGFQKDNKAFVKVLSMGKIVTIMDFDLDIISPAKIRINN